MFQRLFARRRRNEAIAYSLYGTIVAQARQPAFYADFGVPDTLDGRFDMIVLHGFLLFYRLKTEDTDHRRIGQDVFDIFLKDMDRNLREMGVTDMGVPKKLKKMAEAFYGRVGAYDSALTAGDAAALRDALARNIFPDGDGDRAVPQLAAYVEAAARQAAEQPVDAILAGRIAFPELSSPEAT
ncbi:cytochrome b pre-mRNA-processing protein 3 [Kaistia soli DSM 19436]|uniref:Cytochrome b pre-mRNA-processing protein 3 n=1 Tax=Kaistia soli DSM 19436 TaxID=1122133 RepID=A0A1M5K836_9HYPH|nr:ubiquinol-cytochrome C chaperone family protein [Kaistia soli]SHG48740.1 cytochrome b pre-mRNA-processing protein 3 [Kaistia soli DSM 19436]